MKENSYQTSFRRKSTARNRLKPADFSQHISGFDEIQAGDKVVLWCRVSTEDQRKNLDDQANRLRRLVENRGAIVVDAFKYVGNGSQPAEMIYAARLAITSDAWLLAETTSRFIRHPAFNPKKKVLLQARPSDLEDLMFYSLGAKLVTAIDPNASSADEKSDQCTRGQEQKNNRGGRPTKQNLSRKERRRAYWKLVMRMHQDGLSARAISEKLKERADEFGGLTHKSVLAWIREWERRNDAK